MKNIAFDLDGTLTDPLEGIANCIRYSLERLEIECPPNVELATYIGPPLRSTFSTVCASTDADLIENAVSIFRERYSTVGLYENTVYEGVVEMLQGLSGLNCQLFVATAKPESYAKKILEHFSLDHYFVGIYGNDLAGRFDDKAHLLNELVANHSLKPFETVMVGDRRHDVIAGKTAGLQTVGVTYGYGSTEELRTAGADWLCNEPLELLSFISQSLSLLKLA